MNKTNARASHHHGNLKEALIGYAMKAARSGTLDALSLRQAARDLGVSPGAAYRHFEDRDALMRTVAQRGFDKLATRFETVLPFDGDAASAQAARARFYALAKEYVDFARTNYGLWRLMFGPHGLAPDDERDRPSTYEWLEKSLAELARFDIIAPAGPQARFFAWSAIHGLSDLQASPAISAPQDRSPIKDQCEFVLAALADRAA